MICFFSLGNAIYCIVDYSVFLVLDCRHTPFFVDVDLTEIIEVECRLQAEKL